MTLRDQIEEVLSDWDGDVGVSFRSDAISAALDGDDPVSELDGAISEIKGEASAVLDSIERARDLLAPALYDAERAAEDVGEVDGEDEEGLEARRDAARNAAFRAALDGEAVPREH